MATNIINARLGCPDVTVWADWAWQYDYGQILKASGVDLPDAYEVHFSNQETGGTTITQIGNADGVTVPDELLLSGADIFVWIFLHAGLDDGETVYKVVIPVKDRPQPSDEEPTPVQQSAIDQAIAAMNDAVEQTAQDAGRAEAAAQLLENPGAEAETLPTGSPATASYSEGVFYFGLPRGEKGERGDDGHTPDFSIGTVSTLPAGSDATASITGTEANPVLNLGIPQGIQGERGPAGQDGADGFSPIANVTQADGVTTISITDEIGTTTASIDMNDKADVITDTASGSIVSIPDGMASPALGLSVDIEPIQAGTGDPSPDNIRPISGRSEVNVYLEESYDPQATPKATIQLGQTVYGGTVDVTSGKLRINKAIADLTTGMTGGSAGSNYVWYKQLENASTVPNSQIANIKSEAYIPIRYNAIASNVNYIALRDNGVIYVNAGSQSVLPVGNVVYALATPVEVTLTAEELDILYGDNNVWADSGDTTVEYRADTKKYILKKIAEALNT